MFLLRFLQVVNYALHPTCFFEFHTCTGLFCTMPSLFLGIVCHIVIKTETKRNFILIVIYFVIVWSYTHRLNLV